MEWPRVEPTESSTWSRFVEKHVSGSRSVEQSLLGNQLYEATQPFVSLHSDSVSTVTFTMTPRPSLSTITAFLDFMSRTSILEHQQHTSVPVSEKSFRPIQMTIVWHKLKHIRPTLEREFTNPFWNSGPFLHFVLLTLDQWRSPLAARTSRQSLIASFRLSKA